MILPLDSDISLEAGGGKAMNLARLARAGLPVPPGFVISTAAYREFVAAHGLDTWLNTILPHIRPGDLESLETASAAIRDRFAAAPPSASLLHGIQMAHTALGAPPVAVRSSATTEDLPELSFAGQQDTMLHVIGQTDLVRAVVQCWSSLWTARAIAYRASNGIPHESVALAVIVQAMVASEVSGVLFTANPMTGKRSEAVIEATFGLGEALVAGLVEPDRYVVDMRTRRLLTVTTGAKAVAVRAQESGGTIAVAESGGAAATLTDAAALELTDLCGRVMLLYDTPLDIEWARADGRFLLLQARPITSLYPLPRGLPNDGLRVLLSIGAFQGMLDPVTPLGADLLRVALPRAAATLGGHAAHFRPAVVAGERWFLDATPLLARPRTAAMVRGALRQIEPATADALDEIMPELTTHPPRGPALFRVLSPRLLLLFGRAFGNALYNVLWPDRGRRRIQRTLAAATDAFRQRSAAARTLAERVALLQQAFDWVLGSGLPSLMPAMGVGIGSLRAVEWLTAELPDGGKRTLELTRGLAHNVTTEMDLALWDLAAALRSTGTDAVLLNDDVDALARAFAEGMLPAAVQTALEGFLERYGMRGVGEIDLGRPRWRDDPTPLLQVLRSYLQMNDPEQAPPAVFRRGAEAADAALRSLVADIRRTRFGRLKAYGVRYAARRMRALAGLRESPKFTAITMFGAVRDALQASGRDLARAGTLDAPDDIFYLHIEELEALAAGAPGDLRALVGQRRATFARESRRHRVPRVLLSDGRAFFGGAGVADDSGETLAGTPVSPGFAEGFVRVVLDPRTAQLVQGEILVCRGTDPAWTPLFLVAAGLVTEVGGLMTHGAVVAREYGIPAVVGVHDATVRLRTGDRVRVDGTTGRITVVDFADLPREV